MKTRNRVEPLGLLFTALTWAGGALLSACGSDGASPGGAGSGSGAVSGGGTAATSGGLPGAGGSTSSAGTSAGGATSAAGASAGGAPTGMAGAPASGGSGLGGSSAQGGSAGSAEGGSATRGGAGGVGSGGRAGAGGASGGSAGAAGSGAGTAGSGGTGAAGSPGLGLTKDGEVRLSGAGLSLVSYGGYLNGESFQQEGVLSFNGYQYAAFWNTSRRVVLARRALPSGAWASFELADYTNTATDAHNTISLGISPGDGTLHVAFDHHVSNLHYRKSIAGLATAPATATWAASSFSATTSNLVGTTAVTEVTYPRFVTEPGGSKLLFGARLGTSGAGDEYLWEYDAQTRSWTSLGRYLNGTVSSINAYPHGLSYTKGGARLHVSWCWRATSNASTNYDLLYAYSDDHGRTWKNSADVAVATTGTAPITATSPGIRAWAIGQNRGLINQEHMAVDANGRVHVLLSHMPEGQADDATFDSARRKSQFFHYFRDAAGKWTRTSLGLPTVAAFRGKLAIAASNNLYAILPDLRIAGATVASNYASWTLLDMTDTGRFFSDPLIDAARLVSEDKLTVVYTEKSSANIQVLDYSLK